MHIVRAVLRHVALLAVVALSGGLVGALMVRYAPGFEADERLLDPRFAGAAPEERADRDVAGFYFRYVAGMARGDFGTSRTFEQPVRDLLAERIPVTARLAGWGLLAGWATGLIAAVLSSAARVPGSGAWWSAIFTVAFSTASGAALAIPSALTAFAALYFGAPVWLCVAAVIFPRVFRFTRNAIQSASEQLHVTAAAARGVGPLRIALHYVAPRVWPQTIALAGVSVSSALGAAAPVEVLADVPGIGQLVWKAASGRDLPVLIALTLLVTAVTLTANALAGAVLDAPRQEAA